jgi:hypothetical protein
MLVIILEQVINIELIVFAQRQNQIISYINGIEIMKNGIFLIIHLLKSAKKKIFI